VCELVSPEIAISPEYFPALIAFVRLVVSVSQQVGLQVGSLIETSLADRALVGRLLHVKDLVNRQGPGLTESLPTVGTLERLLLGVNVAMVSQVILAAEGFAADITGVRPLVSVGSLVDQQVVGLGELTVAELTHKLLLGFCGGAPGQRGFDDPLINVRRNHCAVTRVLRVELLPTTSRAGALRHLKPVRDGGGSVGGRILA